jgi:hypothetical protein
LEIGVVNYRRVKKWEIVLQKVCLLIALILFVVAVSWNVAADDFGANVLNAKSKFYEPRFRPKSVRTIFS